jgi:hypothetical protein
MLETAESMNIIDSIRRGVSDCESSTHPLPRDGTDSIRRGVSAASDRPIRYREMVLTSSGVE